MQGHFLGPPGFRTPTLSIVCKGLCTPLQTISRQTWMCKKRQTWKVFQSWELRNSRDACFEQHVLMFSTQLKGKLKREELLSHPKNVILFVFYCNNVYYCVLLCRKRCRQMSYSDSNTFPWLVGNQLFFRLLGATYSVYTALYIIISDMHSVLIFPYGQIHLNAGLLVCKIANIPCSSILIRAKA